VCRGGALTTPIARAMIDDWIRQVLLTHRPLGQKHAREIDGPHGDAVEIDCLRVLAQCVEGLAMSVDHDVDDKSVGHADVPALFERLVWRCLSPPDPAASSGRL
jgi:hypothetical protein